VGELHELYDQLGAGASAIRDFQLAGIPLALQTMRYTGAQSDPELGDFPSTEYCKRLHQRKRRTRTCLISKRQRL
jgi:hypothetical protein